MQTINFAKRNIKEIIRDPLSVIFSCILPLFLLFIFQQFNIPNEAYILSNFTPGIILFSFSFVTLFTGTLVAKDIKTSLLIRLGISPMMTYQYILGYILAIIPMVILQNILFFTLAIILGLSFNIYILLTILISIIISIFFILLGILIGSVTTEKSASGVGSIIVQLVVFTSGMYFDKSMVGEVFSKICDLLPFSPFLTILRGVMNNIFSLISSRDILVSLIYILIVFILTIIVFKKQMISDNK